MLKTVAFLYCDGSYLFSMLFVKRKQRCNAKASESSYYEYEERKETRGY